MEVMRNNTKKNITMKTILKMIGVMKTVLRKMIRNLTINKMETIKVLLRSLLSKKGLQIKNQNKSKNRMISNFLNYQVSSAKYKLKSKALSFKEKS